MKPLLDIQAFEEKLGVSEAWDYLRNNEFNFHRIDNEWSDTELYTYCEYDKQGKLTWYAFKESIDDNYVGKGSTEDEAIQEYFVAEAEGYMDNKYDWEIGAE